MVDGIYIAARRGLLDALEAAVDQLDAIVLVGAQAIYLHTGDADLAVAPYTTDAVPRGGAKKKPSIGTLMIRGAREAVAHKRGQLRGTPVTQAKVTVRSVRVVPPPQYGESDVQRVRERLGLSQAVFANLLGASATTVRAWERGARQPSDMARRLLELAERQPDVFEEDLVAS